MQQIRPHPCSRMEGSASRASRIDERRFALRAASRAASSTSNARPGGGPPAFAITMSTLPKAARVAATSRAGAAGSVTSSAVASTSAPPVVSSKRVCSRTSASRAVIITRTPSATRASAVALPRPREAAVTSAVFPSMPRSTLAAPIPDQLDSTRKRRLLRLDDGEVVFGPVEWLGRAVLAHDHDVLQPHAEAPFHIDARLHRERMPGLERLRVSRDEIGVLVLLDADPVTGPMEEVLSESCVVDDLSGHPIDVLGRDTCSGSRHRCRLSRREHLVTLGDLVRRRTGHDRAGDVGAVTDVVVDRVTPTEVADDRLSGPDDSRSGLVMGTCRV